MEMLRKTHYIKGFVATMQEKYGETKEKAEHDIVAFLQVIMDASRFVFIKSFSHIPMKDMFLVG